METDPLRKLLAAAARTARQDGGGDGMDTNFARSSIVEAADALREAYGERALEQARRMEEVASNPMFARLVSRELETGESVKK